MLINASRPATKANRGNEEQVRETRKKEVEKNDD
jgi:hypothetical protein